MHIRRNFPDEERHAYYCSWARVEGSLGFNCFRDRLEELGSFVFRKEE